MRCSHGSNNEILSKWDPGPIYVVQRPWDPGGPSYTSRSSIPIDIEKLGQLKRYLDFIHLLKLSLHPFLVILMLILCLACMMHVHMHGTCALSNMGMSKYLSGLVCMQANLNLEKITASHFWVLNIQTAIENMPNMIPIAYLNKTFNDCSENLWCGVNKNPLFIPMCLCTKIQ